jgi:hypothetical protein
MGLIVDLYGLEFTEQIETNDRVDILREVGKPRQVRNHQAHTRSHNWSDLDFGKGRPFDGHVLLVIHDGALLAWEGELASDGLGHQSGRRASVENELAMLQGANASFDNDQEVVSQIEWHGVVIARPPDSCT